MLTYTQFMDRRRRLGLRFDAHDMGSLIRLDMAYQGGSMSVDIAKDDNNPDWVNYQSGPAAMAGQLIPTLKKRKGTHDFAKPSEWYGDTLPDGHPDKPSTDFVSYDEDGNAVTNYRLPDEQFPRGCFKHLNPAVAFNPADPTTYWEPRSTWRLACPEGFEIVVSAANLDTNIKAAFGGNGARFTPWSWLNAQGVPVPPNSPNSALVPIAPMEWAYDDFNRLRALATSRVTESVAQVGEDVYGPRMALTYTYATKTGDDEARECVLDGRYGQLVEIKLDNHLQVSAATAILVFHYVQRIVF